MPRFFLLRYSVVGLKWSTSSTFANYRKMSGTMFNSSTRGSIITTNSNADELLAMVRGLVPTLTYEKHKGEAGRIAVIGGCKEYTGAPYFAAMSAYRVLTSALLQGTMFNSSTRGSIITTNSNADELLAMVRGLVPTLTYEKHKGKAGRIAVIGGCKEYTGAPYFAAMSAYRVGCDLAHVFCTEGAAPVIKSYSPDLIVHPELDVEDPVTAIKKWLSRMHGIVIGPGLGRDQKILDIVKSLTGIIKAADTPVVVDADGLFLLTQSPDIIHGYQHAILTPNIVEFKHLYKKVVGKDPQSETALYNVPELSNALGNVTVCLKGKEDIISNGRNVIVCSTKGSPRRCGGQGDILSGTMGVFNFWAHQAKRESNPILSTFGPTMCSAYAACLLTRRSSELAFTDHQRSMATTDVLAQVPKAFTEQYEIYKSGL